MAPMASSAYGILSDCSSSDVDFHFYNIDTGNWISFAGPDGVDADEIVDVSTDSYDGVYVVSDAGGLYRFDSEFGTWIQIAETDESVYPLNVGATTMDASVWVLSDKLRGSGSADNNDFKVYQVSVPNDTYYAFGGFKKGKHLSGFHSVSAAVVDKENLVQTFDIRLFGLSVNGLISDLLAS